MDIGTDYCDPIDEYLNSLKENAENQSMNDVYSKSKLFSEACFNSNDNFDTKSLIEAVEKIISSTHNEKIIDKYKVRDSLKQLLFDLIEKRKKEHKEHLLKCKTDSILEHIKGMLEKKSSINKVENVNLYSVMKSKLRIDKYDEICTNLKKRKLLMDAPIGRFRVQIIRKEFENATALKKVLSVKQGLSSAFGNHKHPHTYLRKLIELDVPKDFLYRSHADFEIKVINGNGVTLSGGERAEYNLLHEIKDAEKYDVLLIDEPEASFDNPFINEHILGLIKDISNKTTVFITTHNSTLGVLLKPNLIIYTAVKDGNYKVYTGELGSKEFISVSGESTDSYDAIIDVMEAGEAPYKERKDIYESFRNK